MTATGGKVKCQKKRKQNKSGNVDVGRQNYENFKNRVSEESEY